MDSTRKLHVAAKREHGFSFRMEASHLKLSGLCSGRGASNCHDCHPTLRPYEPGRTRAGQPFLPIYSVISGTPTSSTSDTGPPPAGIPPPRPAPIAVVAKRGFDPRTSGLWALHASTAPLCFDAMSWFIDLDQQIVL